MGKKEVREIPWNQVKIVILVLFSTSINASFTIPISGFFILETKTSDNLEEIGYYSGLLTLAFCLGKLMTWRLTNWASPLYGIHCTASFLLFFSAILTILFGFCTSLIVGLTVRFFAGICSTSQLISKILLRQVSQPCMEKFYQVTYVAIIVQTIGTGIGLIIGGTTSYITIENDAKISEYINHHPFLIPSIVTGFIEFIVFILASTQFADNPLPTQNQQKPKPVIQPKKEPKNTGKYVELEESKKHEEGKDEGPITERKENPNEEEEEEDDLPSYLQVSGIDLMLANSEEPKSSSRHGIHYFSPRGPEKSIDNSKWPMSARGGEVGKVFHIDNEGGESAREREEPESSEPERAGPIQNVKHTHISFVEEDFEGQTEEDNHPQQPVQNISLEDRFKRDFDYLWNGKAPKFALTHLAIFSLCFSAMEEFFTVWFMIQFGMKNIEIGVILGTSYILGYALHIYAMPKLLESVPLWKTIRMVSYIMIGLLMGLVPINYATMPLGIFVALIILISIFKFFSCILLTSSWLFVSDSVNIHNREALEVYADETSMLFKILGSIIGPFMLSAFIDAAVPIPIIMCAAFICVSWLVTLLSFSHFPRFNIYPYRV